MFRIRQTYKFSRPVIATVTNMANVPHSSFCSNVEVMDNSPGKFGLPKRYQGSEASVWVEYVQLAAEQKPLNLGQGFPDFKPPDYITKALVEAASSKNVLLNQYTRGFGHPRLIHALAKLYSHLLKREINPLTEILVTVGGYEALYSAIVGHVDVGDEVIIIEPFFDCYDPMVRSAGGVPRFIPLKPLKKETLFSSDWVLDMNELAGLFNSKTKMIIMNTPHNPLGKVFSEQELTEIANLCKKWNVLCISDEVYEWLVYKPHKHVRIASLPGMWERTITIGSAGKTFNITGWKIGWAYGPANLMTNLQMVHQNSVYTCSTLLQEAIAMGIEIEFERLGKDDCYFVMMAKELEIKRDFMVKFIKEIGMIPTVPDGGFFLVADWTPLASKVDLTNEKDKYQDYRFTKWMAKNVKVLGIPPSAFYSKEHKSIAEDYVRYCFIKTDETLKSAEKLVLDWKNTF